MRYFNKSWIHHFLIILLLYGVFLFAFTENNTDYFYLTELEAKTMAYLEGMQKKTATSFLIARSINATLSML